VIGGQVDMMFDAVPTMSEFARTGKVKALATTGLTRSAVMPDVPTVAEAGVPDYSALQWYGLLAPAGTPQPMIDKLAAVVAEALRAPEVRERLAQDSAEPVGSSPAEFSALVKSELVKWADIARAANIQAE